jgi:hypothetical protein
VAAAAAAAPCEAGDAAAAVAPSLPGPNFHLTTDRQGHLPNSEAADAAIIAARRLAAIGGEGDRLDLQPNMLLTRPHVPPGLIQPPHCNSPAVRDPEGYAVRQAQQMGAWKDRLCAAADDAVRKRPAGQLGVLEFEKMLTREDGAGAAGAAGGGTGTRLQHCDLDYRWAIDCGRCSAFAGLLASCRLSSRQEVICVHWRLTTLVCSCGVACVLWLCCDEEPLCGR